MPLEKRCSTGAMQRNVRREVKAGKSQAQAAAIGYSTLKKACGVTTDRKLTPKEIVARKQKSESSELKRFRSLLGDCCQMLGVKSQVLEAGVDIVDKIMDFEAGTMSDNDTIEFFSELIKSGMVNHLQGFYGRTAAALIQQGYLDKSGKILKYPNAQTVGLGESGDGQNLVDEYGPYMKDIHLPYVQWYALNKLALKDRFVDDQEEGNVPEGVGAYEYYKDFYNELHSVWEKAGKPSVSTADGAVECISGVKGKTVSEAFVAACIAEHGLAEAKVTRTVGKKRIEAWDETELAENYIKDILSKIADYNHLFDDDDELMAVFESPKVARDGTKFIAALKRARLYNRLEKKVREFAYNDTDVYSIWWDDMIEGLTDQMKTKNPDGYWRADVQNFGWRSQSGHKYFKANNGQELLDEILPKTNCTFYIYDFGKDGLAINNYHHDSPTGKEWYYLVPVSDVEFKNQEPVSQAATVNARINSGDFFTGFHSAAGPTSGTMEEIRQHVVKAFEKESGGRASGVTAEPFTEGDEFEVVNFKVTFADKSEMDVTLNIELVPKGGGKFDSKNASIAANEVNDVKAVFESAQAPIVGRKSFIVNPQIGRAKYSISYYDGVSTHKDGSPFYGLKIFHNKRELEQAIERLKADGYIEESAGQGGFGDKLQEAFAVIDNDGDYELTRNSTIDLLHRIDDAHSEHAVDDLDRVKSNVEMMMRYAETVSGLKQSEASAVHEAKAPADLSQIKGRYIFYVPETQFDKEKGYMVAIVRENIPGYLLTDMYAGLDFDKALENVEKMNRDNLKLTPDDVHDIIMSSMFPGAKRRAMVKEAADDNVTAPGIRKSVKAILSGLGLSNKFSVGNIGFSDLARGSAFFVKIQDWSPDVEKANAIQNKVKELYPKGVIVQFSGPGIIG